MHRKKGVIFLLIALFAAVFSWKAIEAYHQVKMYGDIDLRNRIVGTRLLAENKAVYFTKFRDVTDERHMDPWDLDGFRVNRITVSPGLLILMKPLAPLSHGQIQWIWLFLSLAAFLLSFILLFSQTALENRVLAISFGILLLMSAGWILHFERGQIYVFYTLLLSMSWHSYKKERFILGGLIFGILIFLRPTFVIALPFLLLLAKRKKLMAGLAVSAVLGLALSLAYTDLRTWTDYAENLKEWSLMQTDRGTRLANYSHPPVPPSIEGETNLTEYNRSLPFNNTSVQGIIYENSGRILDEKILMLAFLLLAVSAFIIVYRHKKARVSPELIFSAGFLAFMLFEYCSPAPKYSYQFVYWLLPAMILAGDIKKNIPALSLSALGFILNLYPLFSTLAGGEYLLFAGCMLAVFRHSQDGADEDLVIKRNPVP